jgi:secreted Zn-dependent insulinase-like peptidase
LSRLFSSTFLFPKRFSLEWIFKELRGLADIDFKFKQKVPASRFTSRVSSVMQKPMLLQWLRRL